MFGLYRYGLVQQGFEPDGLEEGLMTCFTLPHMMQVADISLSLMVIKLGQCIHKTFRLKLLVAFSTIIL